MNRQGKNAARIHFRRISFKARHNNSGLGNRRKIRRSDPSAAGFALAVYIYRNLCRFLAADFVFAVPDLKGQRIITGQDVLSGGKRPGQLSSVEHRFVIQLCGTARNLVKVLRISCAVWLKWPFLDVVGNLRLYQKVCQPFFTEVDERQHDFHTLSIGNARRRPVVRNRQKFRRRCHTSAFTDRCVHLRFHFSHIAPHRIRRHVFRICDVILPTVHDIVQIIDDVLLRIFPFNQTFLVVFQLHGRSPSIIIRDVLYRVSAYLIRINRHRSFDSCYRRHENQSCCQ